MDPRRSPCVWGRMLAVLGVLVHLTVHVAAGDTGAVADAAWVDGEVATAGERLGAAGLTFDWSAGPEAGVPVEVDTVAQRDALADLAGDATVEVFVVARIADKDDDGWIGGVTWRGGGRRYLIVSRDDARVDTLAHELGHFFGLHHETAEDNLMTSPGRVDGAGLTARQVKTVRRRAAAWRRRHR